MPGEIPSSRRATEARLDRLREEASRTGRVADPGVTIAGGPIPRAATTPSGYYGQPIVKPPVWTWQIGLYFFVGGTSGMSGVLALAALATGQSLELVRAALGVAFAGALISPILLIWDLGRPSRFLNMLRVFKWRSAMSVGVWTLLLFGGFAGSALLLAVMQTGQPPAVARVALVVMVTGTAVLGAILGTYTGVLLGATAIPVWSAHHTLLPFHFGIVGLGSAGAVLELLGFRSHALHAIGLGAAAIETAVGVWLAVRRRRASTSALPDATSGLLLRVATLLTGSVPLLLRIAGVPSLAAGCFLIGSISSRYGWLSAGRSSARDPEQTIAAQSQ
jgi:hypothetical protein